MTDRLVRPLDDAVDVDFVGGKAASLRRLRAGGVPTPDGLVVTTAAYRAFVAHRGLGERIALELARRPLTSLRNEETWDVALRIHAMFGSAPWPAELRAELAAGLSPLVASGPVAVRSSAPHEDTRETSFAGLHESVLGVSGLDAVLDAVRTVWASLFTDRALLYHAELELSATRSAMAVLVQPLVEAERAGVVFTRSPSEPDHGVIEAVWGLGEGLVSGRVEPDTWTIARSDGRILSHREAARLRLLAAEGGRIDELPLPAELADRPPLDTAEVASVWSAGMAAERIFSLPVDAEWVIAETSGLMLTQTRPITTPPADARAAYLASQASVERLEELWRDIEERILPGMRAEADALAAIDLRDLADEELADESLRRVEAVRRWRSEYRSTLIPFAHGARVLGRLYTDALHPDDPFEYLSLLVRTPDEYETHRALLRELGLQEPAQPASADMRLSAEERFLAAFTDDSERERARRVLALGRASWRLRDDDNLYLALIEREAERAGDELRRRSEHATSDRLASALAEIESLSEDTLDSNRPQAPSGAATRPRQLLGQPAGPGVGRGVARVVRSVDDLLGVGPGDIVVADALEPQTAAYASRASGIVERRGGMLVHGAIVAREHGVPCVTGIAGATALIRPGERLTVDGYLGIVVLEDV